MDIHKRALRTVLATVCACSAVAGIGMAAAPGSALAAPCLTGSGSSLQGEQQQHWIALKPLGCAEELTYTSTSSGKGLTEFGLEGAFELTPAESGTGSLDGFIGTDDAPTTTALMKTEAGMKKADTKAETMPIVAAPIAIIVHLPSGCSITGTVNISNIHLSDVFAGEEITWAELLGPAASEGCTGKPMPNARSDASGTSYAFKQYLCQVEPVTWGNIAKECESGDGLVVDAATWPELHKPTLFKHLKGTEEVENKGSAGEVEAVEAEEGSIGYVNQANAAKGNFVASQSGATEFWTTVENGEEPVKNGTEGNCPSEYTGGLPTAGASWSAVHLALDTQAGAYPICTLTYDIGWEKYETTELELPANYNGKTKAKEIGIKAKAYFEYMAGTGQSHIAEYYSPLPTKGTKNIKTLAASIAKLVG
jgi:ABC-type phosphate transport system substrate-binding protein